MWKKWIAVLLSISFVFVAAACGSGEAESDQPQEGDKSEKVEKSAKKVVVGVEAANAPFIYLDKGEVVGFDADLLEAVMKEAGYTYEIKNMGWDPLFAAVSGGEVDMATGNITITEDRKQSYDFSNPYFMSRQFILSPEERPINSADDLKEKEMTVGVQVGTTGAVAIEKLLGKESPNIRKYDTYTTIFMELSNGQIDAAVMDDMIVKEFIKNNPNKKLKSIEDPNNFEPEYLGMMFPKDSDLVPSINDALKKVIESGKYAELYEKWFEQEPDNIDSLLELQQ